MKNTLNEIFSLMERIDSSYRDYAMLNESRAAQKSVQDARKLFMAQTDRSEEDARAFIEALKQKVGALRDNKAAKFTLGVANMYFNGELEDDDTNEKLSNTLMHIAKDSSLFNSLNSSLNGLSAQEIISQFEQQISDLERSQMEKDANTEYTENTDYKIVPINSFEEANRYSQYVVWCITHEESYFNSYTKNGTRQTYFCLRKGFKNEPKEKGENHPLDSYGLSMISVIVDENGNLTNSTSRWNNEGTILNINEISELVGRNFKKTFKPNNKWASALEDAMRMLANGENPKDVFDEVGRFNDGFAVVELKGKYNFINAEGQFLFPNQWYDGAWNFHNGFAAVELDGKHNFISAEGQLLSPNQWFDWTSVFSNGVARVNLKGKYNFINAEGQLLSSNQWFDVAYDFSNGFAKVLLTGKGWNFINTEGQLLSPDQWFDMAYDFSNGFAKVELNRKYNFINKKMQLISPNQWFDFAFNFTNGLARVVLNGEWFLINTKGKRVD